MRAVIALFDVVADDFQVVLTVALVRSLQDVGQIFAEDGPLRFRRQYFDLLERLFRVRRLIEGVQVDFIVVAFNQNITVAFHLQLGLASRRAELWIFWFRQMVL